jgi:hypothetical protein
MGDGAHLEIVKLVNFYVKYILQKLKKSEKTLLIKMFLKLLAN